LLTTAFINEDGKVAVIVMNQSNQKVNYNLCIGLNAAEVTSLPHSIQTLVF
jgi:glucosylceramidase